MEHLVFSRSKALNNIPKNKFNFIIKNLSNSDEDKLKSIAFNRYFEANIPVEYWTLSMKKDFIGDQRLLSLYDNYILNLNDNYINGKSICLAGQHGRGKTLAATNILKKAAQKGFQCLYTTLSDVVDVLTSALYEERFLARRELLTVDFLIIDEFDPRFISTENAADLYARTLETVFRTRSQNKLPTIMCTNSPNVIESFSGSLKESISSLMEGYMEIFPVFGNDFRKNK